MSMQEMDRDLGMASKGKKVYLESARHILSGLAHGSGNGLAG